MSLPDYAGELVGTIPRLPYTHAVQCVNKAWARLRDSRLWSFHVIADAQLFAPAVITAGSVSVTFGSTTITVDTALATAIGASPLNPPIGHPTLGVGRQIRVPSTSAALLGSSNGPYYSIVDWDSTNLVLTIDKPYGESSGTGLKCQILRAYYAAPNYPFTNVPAAPDQGFVRYLVITNRTRGYAIRGKALNVEQGFINAKDPQRGSTGDPYYASYLGRNQLGQPVHELWPTPVTQTTFTASYVTRWPDLTPSQDLPQVSYDLVGAMMVKAKSFAAEWALANVATYSELQQTNWVAYRMSQEDEYKESRILCIKQDDELMPLVPFTRGRKRDLPLDGAFLQTHDISSSVGGLE